MGAGGGNCSGCGCVMRVGGTLRVVPLLGALLGRDPSSSAALPPSGLTATIGLDVGGISVGAVAAPVTDDDWRVIPAGDA